MQHAIFGKIFNSVKNAKNAPNRYKPQSCEKTRKILVDEYVRDV